MAQLPAEIPDLIAHFGPHRADPSGDRLETGAEPDRFESLDFSHFFLQPMDGPIRDRNTRLAIQYCLDHPRWRLSLQTHKLLGIR